MPGYSETGCCFFRRNASAAHFDDGRAGIQECDLFIVIGSSLVVYPAAYMPLYAKRSGANIVIINMGDTGHDDIADVFIKRAGGRYNDEIMERLRSVKNE
jgi:NAD-dependent SIR2 family protein deacetylase